MSVAGLVRRRGIGRLPGLGNRFVAALTTGRGLLGSAIVLVVAGVGLLGPVFLALDPKTQSLDSLTPPGPGHPLGTDELGRDLLARLIYGIRVDILIAVVAAPVGAIIGTVIGLLGTTRGYLDTIVQRTFDVLYAFPGIFLAVSVAVILGPGLFAIIVTSILYSIPDFGRQIRNQVFALRSREFVTASEVVGASQARILFAHILPNAVDVLMVQLALSMSFAVFAEGGLSFIGLGIQLPDPSLGNMLFGSLIYMSSNPNYVLAPIVPITLLVVGFNLMGDGLNKAVLRR